MKGQEADFEKQKSQQLSYNLKSEYILKSSYIEGWYKVSKGRNHQTQKINVCIEAFDDKAGVDRQLLQSDTFKYLGAFDFQPKTLCP